MVIKFGELFQEQISRKKLKNTDEVVFIGMQDVDENATIQNFMTLEYFKVRSGFTYFEKNDVLIAKITPCFENGKGGFADKIPTTVGFGSTEFHILRATENADARYIYYQTKRPKFRLALEGEMVGSAGHRRVPFSAIQNYDLEFNHSIKEQTAIANALSDVDALIAALEKLIHKKSAIKTAAMQQLLTGKKRLPPFDQLNTGYKQTELGEIPEDWEVDVIGNFADLITKGTTPMTIGRRFEQSGITFVKVESVNEQGQFDSSKFAYIDELTNQLMARSRICEGDLLISIAGALGRAIIVPKEILPANTNQALAIIRFKAHSNLSALFVYHYTKSTFFKKHIEAISSQGAQPNLSLGDIQNFPIFIPLQNEQTAIANFLSDMDTELAALQQRLIKIQQLKQGMMQELLTGKTRLI